MQNGEPPGVSHDVLREVVTPLLGEDDDAVRPVERFPYLLAISVVAGLEVAGELPAVLMEDDALSSLSRHGSHQGLSLERALRAYMEVHDVKIAKGAPVRWQDPRKGDALGKQVRPHPGALVRQGGAPLGEPGVEIAVRDGHDASPEGTVGAHHENSRVGSASC